MDVKLQTGWGIFEVLAYVSRSPLEAVRQFVENAADAVEQRGELDGLISLRLERDQEGMLHELVVEDSGVGMDAVKMERVLRSVGWSDKVGRALRGEKGIGILAFALLAEELHLSSCSRDGQPSACLVLRRSDLKDATGQVLTRCSEHARNVQGTTAYLVNVLPEVAGSLTYERLKEHLGRELSSDLRRRLYVMQLEDQGRKTQVEPHRYRGLRIVSQSVPLGSAGHAWVEIHALPEEAPDAAMSLNGEGGVRICSLSTLEAFQRAPWQAQRLEGFVRCDRLKRTADKTAVVQDRVYRELVTALHALEPQLVREMKALEQQQVERRVGRVLRRVDQLVGQFLRYVESGNRSRSLSPPEPVTMKMEMELECSGDRQPASRPVGPTATTVPGTSFSPSTSRLQPRRAGTWSGAVGGLEKRWCTSIGATPTSWRLSRTKHAAPATCLRCGPRSTCLPSMPATPNGWPKSW